ncbi:MAG: hypothetical protein ACRDYZ_09740 [Acidimicrobiales bacterium]
MAVCLAIREAAGAVFRARGDPPGLLELLMAGPPISGGRAMVARHPPPKAESTTFPDEAEAITAKAQALLSHYSTDRAAVGARDPARRRSAAAVRVTCQANHIPNAIPSWYATRMATEQIAVRLPPKLLAELDALVTSGAYESRAAAVRAGVEAITTIEWRRRDDRAVVDGYRLFPPTVGEQDAAMASLRDAIAEEPW